MNFSDSMDAYVRKALTLRGRATRTEILWVAFFLVFVMLLLAKYDHILISAPVMIILLPASISLSVRRLHDMGFNGWWVLLTSLPFLGQCFSLYILIAKSVEGENRFGSDPREQHEPESHYTEAQR